MRKIKGFENVSDLLMELIRNSEKPLAINDMSLKVLNMNTKEVSNKPLINILKLNEKNESFISCFLKTVWLTAIFNVQFLTNEEMVKQFNSGKVDKDFLIIFINRGSLISNYIKLNNSDNKLKWGDFTKLDDYIRENPHVDILTSTIMLLKRFNDIPTMSNILKKIDISDMKYIFEDSFISKNKEAVKFIESVSKCLNLKNNLVMIDKFKDNLIENNTESNTDKNNKKLYPEYIKLFLADPKKMSQNYSLKDVSSKHISDEVFNKIDLNNIYKYLISDNSNKNNKEYLIEKIIQTYYQLSQEIDLEDRNVNNIMTTSLMYKDFLTDYINGCVFNEIGLTKFVLMNKSLGSLIEDLDYIKIVTDEESQSVIKVDAEKLESFFEKVIEKIKNNSFTEFDKLILRELYIKDIIDELDVNAIFQTDKSKYVDGIYTNPNLIVEKMRNFVKQLNKSNIEAEFLQKSEGSSTFLISINHNKIKRLDVLKMISRALLEKESVMRSKVSLDNSQNEMIDDFKHIFNKKSVEIKKISNDNKLKN